MTNADQLIDCYVFIKNLDGSDVTMNKKLEILDRLPSNFTRKRLFETVFSGYVMQMKENGVKTFLFFTLDPRAFNAVLSTVSFKYSKPNNHII
jgi:hypothetical protein